MFRVVLFGGICNKGSGRLGSGMGPSVYRPRPLI